MRLLRVAAALLAVLATGLPARAEGPSTAPAAVLELLPPAIRAPGAPSGLSWVRQGRPGSNGDRGSHLIEIVEDPGAGDAGREWLEVEYTIDPELDARVGAILSRAGVGLGHVILMDPRSGEVFSYVSTDPAAFPATRTYPTASLMKVVTAAAVLRHKPEVATQECRYVGSPYRVWRAHLDTPPAVGDVDSFRRAIAISNNQCFARFAVRDLGEDALLAEVHRVGLLESPAVKHPPGRIEPIEDALDLANLGSGLAGSFVTPLGAARLASLLAEGDLVRPYWVARVRDAHGDPLELPEREAPRSVWSGPLARDLRDQMVEVTARGTASRAFRSGDGSPQLDSIRVSGKTGTLSGTDPDGRYQWFIGVAPAEAPRVAVATVVVSDPEAGTSASEIAAAALTAVFCEGEHCEVAQAERLEQRRAQRAAAEAELEQSLRELTELDAPPRPVEVAELEFPRKLRRREVEGRIVLRVRLSREGRVLDARVESSDLPDFDEFVVESVRSWRFTAPTWRGRPIEATARLPIPIKIGRH